MTESTALTLEYLQDTEKRFPNRTGPKRFRIFGILWVYAGHFGKLTKSTNLDIRLNPEYST